jgi:hypothetical protein
MNSFPLGPTLLGLAFGSVVWYFQYWFEVDDWLEENFENAATISWIFYVLSTLLVLGLTGFFYEQMGSPKAPWE